MNATRKSFRLSMGALRAGSAPQPLTQEAAEATYALRARCHDPLEFATHHAGDPAWIQLTMSRLRRAATRQLRAGRLP